MTTDIPGESLDELPPTQWASHPNTLAGVMGWAAGVLGVGPQPVASMPQVAAADVVLLLVDGLGDRLLHRHADVAPTLSALHTTTLRAGFPATTATSITSLTTGTACGLHGIIGYAFRPDDHCRTTGPRRMLNALRWTMDAADGPSAMATYPPDLVAPLAGALAGLAEHGVSISYVMPAEFRGTGLTQVAFRATGRHLAANTPDLVREGVGTALAQRSGRRGFVYAYLSDLDAAGHRYGPGSSEWVRTLRTVDALVADLAADLPADAVLAVTGDHGMLAAGRRVDLDAQAHWSAGVEMLAGEPRVRHLYVADGARDDVLATWTAELGADARVVTREQAVDEAWFGIEVDPDIAQRIGDVVAVASYRTVLVRGDAEPLEARMIGHHGAWTADEQLVPLLVARG